MFGLPPAHAALKDMHDMIVKRYAYGNNQQMLSLPVDAAAGHMQLARTIIIPRMLYMSLHMQVRKLAADFK